MGVFICVLCLQVTLDDVQQLNNAWKSSVLAKDAEMAEVLTAQVCEFCVCLVRAAAAAKICSPALGCSLSWFCAKRMFALC